jgi:hypothetical protein
LLKRCQAGLGHVGELIIAVPPDRQRAAITMPRCLAEIASFSSPVKNGSTSSNDHPPLPACAQAS